MILELALSLVLQQASQAPSAARELERIEQRLADAWQKGDCQTWDSLLAPEWSVIHITGIVITKADAQDMCRNAPRGTETMAMDELSVRLFGDAAVVTGRTRVTGSGAAASTLTLRFSDFFVRRNGQWQVVASHATRIGS